MKERLKGEEGRGNSREEERKGAKKSDSRLRLTNAGPT